MNAGRGFYIAFMDVDQQVGNTCAPNAARNAFLGSGLPPPADIDMNAIDQRSDFIEAVSHDGMFVFESVRMLQDDDWIPCGDLDAAIVYFLANRNVTLVVNVIPDGRKHEANVLGHWVVMGVHQRDDSRIVSVWDSNCKKKPTYSGAAFRIGVTFSMASYSKKPAASATVPPQQPPTTPTNVSLDSHYTINISSSSFTLKKKKKTQLFS